MFANPLGSIDADTSYNLESCFLATSPGECSPESFTGYTEELKAVWVKIIELRKGKATILRATDIYNPLVKNWQAAGVYESCTTCWSAMSASAREAAEAYNIPFISRYDAFNGAAHDDDPREKGYIRDDGEHPTPLMGEAFADMMAATGYESVTSGK